MPTAAALDLEDIEDLVSGDAASLQRNNLKNVVLPHPRLTTFKKKAKSINEIDQNCRYK